MLREAVVDVAIDRAVRRIAQVDPRPGLSRRVHSRLTMPARGRPVYLGRYMAISAALVMLVLAVGLLRPDNAREVAPRSAPNGHQPAERDNFADQRARQAEASSPDRMAARREPGPPAESLPDGPAKSASSTRADSSAAGETVSSASKTASRAQSPDEKPATESQLAAIGPQAPGIHAESIQMPEIVNLFGGARNLVTGANVAGVEEAPAASSVRPAPSPLEVGGLPMVPLTIEPLRITPLQAPGKER